MVTDRSEIYRIVGVVKGTDDVGSKAAAADHAVRLEALGKTRGGLEVTPVDKYCKINPLHTLKLDYYNV